MKKKINLKGMIITFCALLMVGVAGLSFTLAKYVKSESETTGSAQVAEFGVIMTWNTDSAFATSYTGTDNTTTVVQAAGADATGDVIAPGTSGSVTLTFSGEESEVAFKLAIDIAEVYTGTWEKSAGGEVYHPIKFSVTSNLTANDDTKVTDIDSENSATVEKEFAAGTKLNGTITITWEWPFEVTEGENVGVNDEADTHMSGQADATYAIKATASITQINAFTPAE